MKSFPLAKISQILLLLLFFPVLVFAQSDPPVESSGLTADDVLEAMADVCPCGTDVIGDDPDDSDNSAEVSDGDDGDAPKAAPSGKCVSKLAQFKKAMKLNDFFGLLAEGELAGVLGIVNNHKKLCQKAKKKGGKKDKPEKKDKDNNGKNPKD